MDNFRDSDANGRTKYARLHVYIIKSYETKIQSLSNPQAKIQLDKTGRIYRNGLGTSYQDKYWPKLVKNPLNNTK